MDLIKSQDDVQSSLIIYVHINSSTVLHKPGAIQSVRRLNKEYDVCGLWVTFPERSGIFLLITGLNRL